MQTQFNEDLAQANVVASRLAKESRDTLRQAELPTQTLNSIESARFTYRQQKRKKRTLSKEYGGKGLYTIATTGEKTIEASLDAGTLSRKQSHLQSSSKETPGTLFKTDQV